MARVRITSGKSIPVHAKASGKAKPSSRPLRIPLRRGTLTKHGYSTHDPQAKRRAALARAVKAEGWLSVFRKLNAVAIYSKHKPAGAVFLRDRDYVKRRFSGK
jgi:hypothetical protein